MMKAISLWQPWASAIALGHKRIETRHWTTKWRGEIAIHASQRFGTAERAFASVERSLGRIPERIPLGAIVAIARIVDVRTTEDLIAEGMGPIEKLYGNYEPGRFGWVLEDIRALAEPIGCKGRQGFFNLSAEVEAAVRKAVEQRNIDA